MKRSLFSITLFGNLLISISGLSLLYLFSARVLDDHIRDSQDEHLQHMALALRHSVDDRRADDAGLENEVRALDRETGARVTVVSRDGRVLADSESDPQKMENHADRPEIIAALQGRTGRSTRFSSTIGLSMRYVAVPYFREGRIDGALRVALPQRSIAHIGDRLQSRIASALGVLLLLSLLLALWFSRSISAPIRRLAEASQQVADGDTGVRLRPRGSREIVCLTANFNGMVERLQLTIGDLTHNQEQLKAILASLREGLLVLDGEGRIRLFNESACQICGHPQPAGLHYWEIVREAPFTDLLARALREQRDLEEGIELGNRSFQACIRFLASNGHLLITLHDVSEFKVLEKIKRDFLINFSHELRTPLTAIKGYAETLAEEGPTGDPAYLDIIRRHTDRLIALVNDMLSLSELEEKRLVPEWREVRLEEICADVLRLFEKRAREKGITLSARLEPAFPLFRGEPERIEQLLINLVDNALKYTEHGEISIRGERRRGEVAIRVRDSGAGIPGPHLARIFERFYVVDKSRARSLGGTGLGLAIVKHIVMLHHGRIDVDSQPGQGTEFVIALPIDPERLPPDPMDGRSKDEG